MRHTYHSMVEATGAILGVPQKLMRHSDIATIPVRQFLHGYEA